MRKDNGRRLCYPCSQTVNYLGKCFSCVVLSRMLQCMLLTRHVPQGYAGHLIRQNKLHVGVKGWHGGDQHR